MKEGCLKNIVILGAGLEGWSAAVALAKRLKGLDIGIRVIDDGEQHASGSVQIPGESEFHQLLGLDERTLIKRCSGTFRLATQYVNWHRDGHDFYLGGGECGANIGPIHFSDLVNSQQQLGTDLRFERFSVAAIAASQGRFSHPSRDRQSVLSTMDYTLQLDKESYRCLLKASAKSHGVGTVVGRVSSVDLNPSDGGVERIQLMDGESIEANLFLDCSGHRATLLDGALGDVYKDWSQYLPCNRQVKFSLENIKPNKSLGVVLSHAHGWIEQTPLRDKTAYNYTYQSEVSGTGDLLDSIQTVCGIKLSVEPKIHDLSPGRREQFWKKNCVALGAAAGQIDPSGLAGVHLLHEDILRLISLLPGGQSMGACSAEYNRRGRELYEHCRDFYALYYCSVNKYTSSKPVCDSAHRQPSNRPFWRHCQSLELPDSLASTLDLFMARCKLKLMDGSPIEPSRWYALLNGLGFIPQRCDPKVFALRQEDVKAHLQRMQQMTRQAAESLPPYDQYINQFVQQ